MGVEEGLEDRRDVLRVPAARERAGRAQERRSKVVGEMPPVAARERFRDLPEAARRMVLSMRTVQYVRSHLV